MLIHIKWYWKFIDEKKTFAIKWRNYPHYYRGVVRRPSFPQTETTIRGIEWLCFCLFIEFTSTERL